MSAPLSQRRPLLVLLGASALAAACGGSTPEAAGPERVEGEASELQYALVVKAGDGTMIKPTQQALNDALLTAGFRVGDVKDADVILEAAISDVDAPQFMKIVVNGKEQKKRKVTVSLKAIASGKTLERATRTFTVDDGDEAVEAEEVSPLARELAGSKALEKYGLEISIERAQRRVSTPKSVPSEPGATAEPSAPPAAPPAENTSKVREH
ncbi:MAG: hypothetical protein IPM79_30240 [Polyangiaceae bacterium]|jgi:hypothetical protein|nr:hypothetical protein [Polyangiaceae bacterium]